MTHGESRVAAPVLFGKMQCKPKAEFLTQFAIAPFKDLTSQVNGSGRGESRSNPLNRIREDEDEPSKRNNHSEAAGVYG
jgi:hypothetical protein